MGVNRTESNRIGPNQIELHGIGPTRTKSAEANQNQPKLNKIIQHLTESDRIRLNRGPNRIESDKIGSNQIESDRIGMNRTEWD